MRRQGIGSAHPPSPELEATSSSSTDSFSSSEDENYSSDHEYDKKKVKKGPGNVPVPSFLEEIVSKERWESLSAIKQQQCAKILKTPNSFFFRYRPPWDKHKFGAFSPEEDAMFFERLKYFKSVLGVANTMWGLFAVPFAGRVGYQLSTYYRAQVKNGRINDETFASDGGKKRGGESRKHDLPKEAVARLNREAIEMILKQIESNNDSTADTQRSKIRAHTKEVEKEQSKDVPEKKDQANEGMIMTRNRERKIMSRLEKKDDENKRPRANGSREAGNKSEGNDKRSAANIIKRERKGGKEPKTKEARENVSPWDYKLDDISPLFGALDPLTRKPMRHPAMNENGYVMDYDSWVSVLQGRLGMPHDTSLQNLKDLKIINGKTYETLKYSIVNFPPI